MARRNDHTRDELVSMTLEQVKQFLDSRPHHELSLRKVAGMIGYVPSTLVNIFGNYNLLLLHVVAQAIDELQQEVQNKITDDLSAAEVLRSQAHSYLAFAIKNPYRWQLIFQHSMNGEELPEWQTERIDNLTNMLESLIAEINPNLQGEELNETSRVVWAGVHGITTLVVDNKLFTSIPLDGPSMIDNLIDTFICAWKKQ